MHKNKNNQFNNVLLNAQNKINCNKITKIREERNANSIYTDSATFHVYVQSSSNSLEIFTIFAKKNLQLMNYLGISLSYVQDSHSSRDKQSLDHNNSSQKVHKFFSLLEKMI